MWSIAVMAVMISLVGVYTTMNAERSMAADASVAMNMAGSMLLYRAAVVHYFTEHDVLDTSVSLATLKSANALPAWSTLYQQDSAPLWSNYRDADGTIYIYAISLPAVDITAEITRLSQNTVLTGVYLTGMTTLQSPVFGDTHIPLTALNGKSIPDGAPVWIATQN